MARSLATIERKLDGIAFLVAEQASYRTGASINYEPDGFRTEWANRAMRAVHRRVAEHLAEGRSFDDLLRAARASERDDVLADAAEQPDTTGFLDWLGDESVGPTES